MPISPSLWIIVYVYRASVLVRVSTIKNPLLSYCTLQRSSFTHGLCTYILYCLKRASRCFYCVFFHISFPILEHAHNHAKVSERRPSSGLAFFFSFVSKVFCLVVQSVTSSFVGELCLRVDRRSLRSLSRVAVKVLFN